MNSRKTVLLILLAGLLVGPGMAAQARANKAGKSRTMRWASSVLLGVEEARLRNVPIVLQLMSDT